MRRVRIAIVSGSDGALEDARAMLRDYSDRVEVVELDADQRVGQEVDIALYDSSSQADSETHDIAELLANACVGKVVIFSSNTNPISVKAALAAGASGYLSKQLCAQEIVEELEAISSGALQTSEATSAGNEPASKQWPGRDEGLTRRESEILTLIAQGLSNVEIASKTYLSLNSIKTYIRRAYRRIGVRDRSNAIIWAMRHGLDSNPYQNKEP